MNKTIQVEITNAFYVGFYGALGVGCAGLIVTIIVSMLKVIFER